MVDMVGLPVSPSGHEQALDDLGWLVELARQEELAEIEVVGGGCELRVVTGLPAEAQNPVSAEVVPDVPAIPEGAWAVTSPLNGIFYRAKTPDDPPYVEVGEKVKKGETVCIVEVAKTVNHVEAPCGGTVHTIRVENEEEVKRDQTLMYIDPNPGG